jgi:multiple sugar transport system permease protein
VKPIKTTIVYGLLLMGIVIFIGPMIYMFLISLTQNAYSLPSPIDLMLSKKDFMNYISAWNQNHFARYFLNSALISVITVTLSLFVGTITAYAFARFTFPGRELLFRLFIVSMIIPQILNIIQQFTIIKSLHLVDTYRGLILIYVSTSVAGTTFFLRSFFQRIPKELDESVVMDGGSRWTIFRTIYIPMSLPAIGTLAIFSFQGVWDEFVVALTLLKSEGKRTLPIALQLFQGEHTTQFGLFFAASFIQLLPIFIIFILFQKRFVNPNLTDGSIKG